jgi:hypothetical protein
MTPVTDDTHTDDTQLQLSNRLFPVRKAVIVTVPGQASSRSRLTPATAILVLVFLGLALRAVPMIQNRCLWIDEAMLALNLVHRTPLQLLEPLDWNQGAPAGFLLLTKAAITLFGESEWALRLVGFVGSILGMLGFTWLSRRLLPEWGAGLTVALFAISPTLITYSAECKQYATDAALTVGLFAISLRLLQRESGFHLWARLALAGACAVWIAHPSVFVLGGIGTALFIDALSMKDRRRALACAATIACWLLSFGLCYLINLRHLGHNQYLLDYWAGHFMAMPPRSLEHLAWLASHFTGFLDYPGGLGGGDLVKAGGLAAAFFFIGLMGFVRERWTIAAAIVLPACLALVASGLHKYPFAGRLLLFLVPLLLLTVGRGMTMVLAVLWPRLPVGAYALLAVLLLSPLVETYQNMKKPLRYEQLTLVLADLRHELHPGDRVYLYYGGVPAFEFYNRRDPFPVEVVKGNEYRENRTGYRDELRKLAGEPRVWLVFSHRHKAEESLLRAYAESLGEFRQEIRHPGATAFLYDFSSSKPGGL